MSEPARDIALVGDCDFKKIMQYRLDTETALVLVSAVTFGAPGSASAGSIMESSVDAAVAPDAPCVVSVEHMQKLSKDDVTALVVSMAAEWKSVLTAPQDLCKREFQSASDKAYWTPESVTKVRRVQSEPMSPGPATD